ncbi:hypothetical protein C0J52_17100 [Blattella germanica]|nr:hypothetical protein C0J52_17100 [Blattella germanica]
MRFFKSAKPADSKLAQPPSSGAAGPRAGVGSPPQGLDASTAIGATALSLLGSVDACTCKCEHLGMVEKCGGLSNRVIKDSRAKTNNSLSLADIHVPPNKRGKLQFTGTLTKQSVNPKI